MDLATQLLSEHVAAAAELYLPHRASEARAIRVFDRWFDVSNSRAKCDVKPERCAFGAQPDAERAQRSALTSMEALIRGVTKIPKNKGDSDTRPTKRRRTTVKKLPFQDGIIRNCRSLPGLLSDVRQLGVTYIKTARLNQDLVENCFSQMRAMGGANPHPNAVEAQTRLRFLMMAPQPIIAAGSKAHALPVAMERPEGDGRGQFLTATTGVGHPSQRDSRQDGNGSSPTAQPTIPVRFVSNGAMASLDDVTPQNNREPISNIDIDNIEIVFADVSDQRKPSALSASDEEHAVTPATPAAESLAFVAGYVAAKCRDAAPSLGKRTKDSVRDSAVPSTWIRAISRGDLTVPSQEWFQTVEHLEQLFREEMGPRFSPHEGVKSRLRARIHAGWPELNSKVVAKYVTTRLWMRIRWLNEKKRSESAMRRASQQRLQHAHSVK